MTIVAQPGAADTLERHKYALEQNRKACRERPHLVEACTALIEQSRLTPAILAEAYRERADAFLFHEDYDRAIADYSEAIRISPGYAEALNGRGFVYARKQQYDLAVADYDSALKAKPDYGAVWANRGRVDLARNDLDKAIADLNEAIRLRPDHVLAWFDRGRAWRQKGEPDRAIGDFTKAIQLDIRFAAAFENRGLAYRDRNKPDLAIADFTEALEIDPGRTNALIERGLAHETQGRIDLAMQDYDQAIQISPDDAWAYNLRGLAHAAQHQDELAIADYDQALRLSPHYSAAFNDRGMAYARYRQWDRAVADYDQAIRENKQNANAFRNRGYTFAVRLQFQRAIADYDAAIRINPKFAWAFDNRGYAYFNLHQYDRAIADFDQAIKLSPGYADAVTGRNAVLLKMRFYSARFYLISLILLAALPLHSHRKYLAWYDEVHGQAHIDAQRMIAELTEIRDLLIAQAGDYSVSSLAALPKPAVIPHPQVSDNGAPVQLIQPTRLPGWMTRDVSPRTGAWIIAGGCALILLVPAILGARHVVTRANATRRDPVAAFVQYFDDDIAATAPTLMKIARRDPEFHKAFLERSKQAYEVGGWEAVNTALYPFLEQQIAVYAGDDQVLRLAAAHWALLTTLRTSGSLLACKTLGLAPRTGPSLPYNKDFMAELVGRLVGIVTDGGQAKAEGATWIAPSQSEVSALWLRLRHGAQPLSDAEVIALRSRSSADADTYCQATIKIVGNILSLPTVEGARAYRILLGHAEQDDWLVGPPPVPGAVNH